MNNQYYLLNEIKNFSYPFQYSLIENVYPPKISELLFKHCKMINQWHYTETNFYNQFECYLGEEMPLPSELSGILDDSSMKFFKKWAEEHFGMPLNDNFEIVVHKLTMNQFIDTHTDYNKDECICRLVVQLSDTDYTGGELSLSNSNNEVNVIQNKNNLGFAFIPSETSFHKIKKVLTGERYTIVYTFYGNR